MSAENTHPAPADRTPASDPVAGSRFVLVAGEASGDLLGAGLIEALRQRCPGASFAGIGGPQMAAAGMDCWHQTDDLAVMGLAEVLGHLPRLLRLRKRLVGRILDQPPICFIGIDAPDFNLGLARRLKSRGLCTVQYVSPSIWAWRQGRAARIGESVDRVLALFPFEPAIYRRHGVDARFVGHPLADRLPLEPDRSAARQALGLPRDPDRPVIALLPGSRRSELSRIAPVIAETVGALAADLPEAIFVSPAASPATRELFLNALSRAGIATPVRVFDGQAEAVLTAADVAVVASGTATLEALLTKTPMVVIYRLAAATYFIVRQLGMLKIDRYSLPNVLAGDALVPELMQRDLTPASLTDAVKRLLSGEDRQHLLSAFSDIHQQLRQDASAGAADAVLELIEARSC